MGENELCAPCYGQTDRRRFPNSITCKLNLFTDKFFRYSSISEWLINVLRIPYFIYRYNIVYFLLTYMVPIVAMGICYGRIGSVLWGRKNQLLRENACNDLARQRKLHSKRKVWAYKQVAKVLIINFVMGRHDAHFYCFPKNKKKRIRYEHCEAENIWAWKEKQFFTLMRGEGKFCLTPNLTWHVY